MEGASPTLSSWEVTMRVWPSAFMRAPLEPTWVSLTTRRAMAAAPSARSRRSMRTTVPMIICHFRLASRRIVSLSSPIALSTSSKVKVPLLSLSHSLSFALMKTSTAVFSAGSMPAGTLLTSLLVALLRSLCPRVWTRTMVLYTVSSRACFLCRTSFVSLVGGTAFTLPSMGVQASLDEFDAGGESVFTVGAALLMNSTPGRVAYPKPGRAPMA
mmetsp:Transcript_59367/g.133767  ORF Transcript_59367/g.133767 Transcript_59367/m.133767 type:complete len:214 (+) Transcript_59367:637-1278(+)